MRPIDAIEVAHNIQELLKTHNAIKQLEQGVKEVYVPENMRFRVRTEDGTMHDVELPPHVMRRLVSEGRVLMACKLMVREHEKALSDMAGITLEID